MDKDKQSNVGGQGSQPGREDRGERAVPYRVDPAPLDEDEMELIGDLGSDFDDPEGWMSERAGYWTTMRESMGITRDAWLVHRIAEAFHLLRDKHISDPWRSSERVPDQVWKRMADEALGLAPSPQLPHAEPVSDESDDAIDRLFRTDAMEAKGTLPPSRMADCESLLEQKERSKAEDHSEPLCSKCGRALAWWLGASTR